ncbi:MAG: inositol phosphate phosphatase SopB, partial [Gammaproteobacteria bacterium]
MGNGTSAVGNQSNQINIRQSPPPSSNDTGATGGVNQTTQQRGKVVTWLRKVTGKEARAITERTHNAIDNLAQRTFQEYGVESSAELVLHTLGDKMPDGKQIKDRTVRANVLERVTERGIKQVEMQNSTIASRAQGLADLDEAGVMTDAQLEALTQVGILATDIDEAVLHSDRTLSILDEGHQLSGEDMENVQTSLAAAKYNLARLPAALEKLKQENPDPALGKYVDRLQQDLINRHMEVADMMCKYDLDEAPPMSGVSRGDRIEANILQATAALKVAQGLDVPGLTAEGKQEIVGALQDHLQELKLAKDMTTGGPTEDSVAQDTDLLEELASTKFALGGKKKKKADPKAMEALQKRWNEQASSTNENKSWLPVTDSKVSQPDMLKAFMQHRLKAAGVKKEAMPDLKAQFKKGVNEARNERNWNPIESTLQFSVGDKTVKVQSTITPASNFSQHFAADYEKNGVNCFERMQGEHVPNLAHTELKDESGKTVFSGLRHGILDSYEISAGSLQKLPDSELREMVDKYLNPAEKHTYDSTDTENIPEAKLESRADTV